jgi:branched-chain amino acid aminotransferase
MKRVWHGGKLVADSIALLASDRGLSLGDGVFETLAVKDGIALWRGEHVARMKTAARALGIAFPEQEIESAIDGITQGTTGSCVLRLTLTRGETGRGLAANGTAPTVIATLDSFDEALRFQPVKLATVTTRRNMHSITAHHKTLSYLDNVMAAREAENLGADDGVMLNTAGRVACTTMANIFLETPEGLITPALEEGVLPGIMRSEILRLARLAGCPVEERPVTAAELATAEAMFTSNSLRFIRPVTMLDGRKLVSETLLYKLLEQGLRNCAYQGHG